MWPFKKKEYQLLGLTFKGKPSYLLRGIAAGIELRKQIGKQPRYIPSNLITKMTDKEIALSALLEERNKAVLDQIKKEPNLRLSLQQMTETFMLVKLAEYELRLQKLEAK